MVERIVTDLVSYPILSAQLSTAPISVCRATTVSPLIRHLDPRNVAKVGSRELVETSHGGNMYLLYLYCLTRDGPINLIISTIILTFNLEHGCP